MKAQKLNREDYESPKGTASWWAKDGAWHIALPEGDGVRRWTAAQFNTREEAIAAIEST